MTDVTTDLPSDGELVEEFEGTVSMIPKKEVREARALLTVKWLWQVGEIRKKSAYDYLHEGIIRDDLERVLDVQ